MSSPGTAGSLGSVTIRLAEWLDLEDRYQRNYIPVTPASREIAGAEAAIAPETTIATWHIDDFAAGEGDVIWRNRNRYNESDTLAPANDGSGMLVVGPAAETTQFGTGGSGDFDEGYRFAKHGANLYAAFDSGGTLCNAAVALKEQGAKSVAAYVTHGVFSGGAVARVEASPMEALVITDSIQASDAVKEVANIQQLTVAHLLGEAILRITEERSVSSLFC